MLRPSVVAGTARAAISGRNVPWVTPGTGASGSSRRASSRPRAADAARESAAPSASPSGQPGKRDARPFHAERPGVGFAVSEIVEGGEDVVEEVFYICAKTVEIALRGTGQIGATLYFVAADSEAVFVEVGGEHVGTAFNQVPCTDVLREAGLWFCRALFAGVARWKATGSH